MFRRKITYENIKYFKYGAMIRRQKWFESIKNDAILRHKLTYEKKN